MYRWLRIAPLLLGGCGTTAPPIAVSAYCEVKGTERINMTDAGLRKLTPENQRAVLTGDDNWKSICGANGGGLTPGPR